MYIGETETISKDKIRQLLIKALKTHQDLLQTAQENDKNQIVSNIEKIDKILDLYFNDTRIGYWAVLPSYQKPTGDQTEMWPIWKEKQIVSIRWRDLVEKYGQKILNYSSYDEFLLEYRKVYPETQVDMVWKFIYEMREGDVVLVNKGHKTIFGRGIIRSTAKIFGKESIESSEYSELLTEWPIYREVEWEVLLV